MPVADAPLRGGARRKKPSAPKPPTARQVRNAQAQRNYFKSQGAQVAASAYLAAPRKERAKQVSAARHAPARTPGQSQVLGIHGVRTSAHTREHNRLVAPGKYYAGSTPRVLPINRQPVSGGGFGDLKGYTKRALKGKVSKAEHNRAVAATGTPSPDIFGKLAKAGLGGTKDAVLFTNNQLLRPSTAVGSAITGHGLKHGFLHPEENTKVWNEAAAKTGVKNKYLKGAIALTGSIAGDPLTYATLGTSSLARTAGKKAFEEVLAQTGDHALAGQAARAAFEAAPAAHKYSGLTVGVRGTPARAIRRATGGARRAPVMSRPLSLGRTRAAGAKVGVKHVPSGGKVARNVGSALSAATRPHGVGEMEWDIIHRAGTAARAGERSAQRHGDRRLQAYHRVGLDEAQQAKVARAVEDVHTEAPIAEAEKTFRAHGLSEPEKQFGHALREDALAMARREGIPTSGPRVGFHEAPVGPAGPAPDVAASRARMHSLRDRLATAHRQVGAERGRRQVLGLRVPGLAKTPSLGQEAAHLKVSDLQAQLKDATRAHQVTRKAAVAHKQATRDYERELAAFARAPHGYVPRTVRPGALTEAASHRQPTGRGPSGLGTSAQRRSVPVALKHMTPEQLEKYEPRLHVAMGHRTTESYRRAAAADLNQRIAGLGTPISAEEAGHLHNLAAKPNGALAHEAGGVFIRDEKGFTPAFDKWGKLDSGAIKHAIGQGKQIIRVDAEHMAKVRDLARGSKDPGKKVVLKGYVGATRNLKVVQTQINPSFHLRNLMGDLWNAAGQGARLRDLPDAVRLSVRRHYMDVAEKNLSTTPAGKAALAKLKKLDKHEFKLADGSKVTGTELLGMAEKYGAIKTGIGAAELQGAARGEDIVDATRRAKAMNKLAKAGDVREDFGRLISFKRGLEQGLSPERAAQSTLVSHFDYSNLTPAEQTIRDYFIPFWTFFARNTALQARTVATHPGLYASTEKARRQSLYSSGVDPNLATQLSGFEQNNLPWGTPAIKGVTRFKVPGATIPLTASPALPIMDLGNLPFPSPGGKQASFRDFVNGIASRVNPVFRTPYEVANQINTFTGKQRTPEQGTLVPAPSYFKLLPNEVRSKLGIRQYRDKASGKMIDGVPWAVLQATKLAPLPNLASKAGTPAPPGAPSPLGTAVAGWLTGPRYAAQDPRAIGIQQLYDRNTILTKRRGDLEQRVPKHKRGDKWGGQVKKIQDEINRNQVQIYRLGKELGIKNPAGKPPGKGRRAKAKLATGLSGGGFTGGTFGSKTFGSK